MTFLKNAWYVAAWSTEVEVGKLLSRRLLDEPVVIYRDPDGCARALTDRRPIGLRRSRWAGSSMEFCSAHTTGCDSMVRETASTTLMGPCRGPHACGASRSPSDTARSGSGWATLTRPLRARSPSSTSSCRSSGTSVPGTWPSTAVTSSNRQYSRLEPHRVPASAVLERSCEPRRDQVRSGRRHGLVATLHSRRLAPSVHLPGVQHSSGNLVDRWLDVRWQAPALMALWTGGVAAGRSREDGVNVPSAHLFTPETVSRTHYFYAMAFLTRSDRPARSWRARTSSCSGNRSSTKTSRSSRRWRARWAARISGR